MTDRESPTPEFVACETVACIVHHVRRIGDTPVNPNGHWPKPLAMCGTPVNWDTKVPPTEKCISCRGCRVAMGWPEMMATRRG